MHKQTLIQVRATVDAGVVDLVRALNCIPCAYTISSCEGDVSNGTKAYVMFSLHDSVERDSLSLLQNLSGFFADFNDVELQLKWKFDKPTFYLLLHPTRISVVTRRIRDGLKKKKNSTET